jgi:uncharacterized protein with PIN domain
MKSMDSLPSQKIKTVTSMFPAKFYFKGPLRDLLTNYTNEIFIEVQVSRHETIKHIIESLGVPHTEVEAIIVNGHYVGFNHFLNSGDIVDIYPANYKRHTRIKKILRDDLVGELRFVLDSHLGKLAAYLRLLGYDSLYKNDYEDSELAKISHLDNRYLLTRDRNLLKRTLVAYGYLIREKIPSLQLIEVVHRFKLRGKTKPYVRCSLCNGLLIIVPKAEIADKLEPKTRLYYDDFRLCIECDQIYWKGTHFIRMEKFFNSVLSHVSKSDDQKNLERG